MNYISTVRLFLVILLITFCSNVYCQTINDSVVSEAPLRMATSEPKRISNTPKNKDSKKENIPAYRKGKKIMTIDSFIIEKNVIIQLPNVKFDNGASELYSNKSFEELNKLVKILNDYPEIKIQIQGHICCKTDGSDGYDPKSEQFNLSEMRARFVYRYLQTKEISKKRMSYVGFGSARKLFAADLFYPDKAYLNRRIEIEIIEE